MKDAYSFHRDGESLRKTYMAMHGAYSRIFERCGLKFTAVEADSGAIGGDFTHEFMVLAGEGESEVVSCGCGYSATLDKARTTVASGGGKTGKLESLGKVHTPGMKTADDVAKFLGVSTSALVKTLLYQVGDTTVAALIPGDRELNEAKLRNFLRVDGIEMSNPEEILKCTGGPLGFSGPVGLKGTRLIADERLKHMENFVVGANEEDYHYTNANPDRDFTASDYTDLVLAREGDACVKCGQAVSITRGIEVGQIFELGTKYSKAMHATYLEQSGQESPFVMGCYGLGVTRTVAAVIEQNHDADGIIWPLSVAPYDVEILPTNVNDEALRKAGDDLYEMLLRRGLEVLLDDRDQRPGFKFKDADLIGLPLRIVVGEKAMAEGKVEIRVRRTGESMRVLLNQAPETIQALIAEKKVG